MKKGARLGLWAVATTLLVCLIAGVIGLPRLKSRVITTEFAGVVLVQDEDPTKRVPVGGADVRVAVEGNVIHGSSDETGYFHLQIVSRLPNPVTLLTIRHADYQPIEGMQIDPRQLFIARLAPMSAAAKASAGGPTLSITNVKLRYTLKAENTINVGSLVRAFPVPNSANRPCEKAAACSPDKKWKATITTVSYDAGDSNRFTNVRASCVAGPCAFTRIEASNIGSPVRVMHLSVRNWSDPATYLIEAEVSRTMVSDMVRESFPAIFGAIMDFTLPASAEGPSIEAELNGTSIVFPLGPNLLLSWATCTAVTASGQTRLFRCELKPSFVFR